MQWQKKNIGKYLALSVFIFLMSFSYSVFSSDEVAEVFESGVADTLGSSNSLISVDENLEYINRGNNSSVVGNYFNGYYHDSIWGYFSVQWSNTANQNIRVVGSTDFCSSSYGYKLGGYAYSEYHGFIDFDYNDEIFVYYCDNDKSLHGYGYNSELGLQSFEGISFEIEVESSIIAEEPTQNTIFTNDTSGLTNQNGSSGNTASSTSSTSGSSGGGVSSSQNSSGGGSFIQGNEIQFEAVEESLFYIIK